MPTKTAVSKIGRCRQPQKIAPLADLTGWQSLIFFITAAEFHA
jgi:hypothetical protein